MNFTLISFTDRGRIVTMGYSGFDAGFELLRVAHEYDGGPCENPPVEPKYDNCCDVRSFQFPTAGAAKEFVNRFNLMTDCGTTR